MAGFKIPVFEKGSILTHEMLETMKSYTVDLGNLLYAGYSDGIISGCEVYMSDGMLCVGRGIVMFQEKMYFLPNDMKVAANQGNNLQILRLTMGNIVRDKNFMVGEINLELSSDTQDMANKIELSRFRLQSGALLRSTYKNFADMNTEYDTLNVIYSKWSGYKDSTISPYVLRQFAREMIEKNVENAQDAAFIQQVLSLDGKTMSREAISFYITSRLKKPFKNMTNEEIYKGLREVLQTAAHGTTGQPAQQRAGRRIIID